MWIPLFVVCSMLATCGGGSDDKHECATPYADHTSCHGDKVYLCPAGNAQDAAANQAIDDDCQAFAGNDSSALAKCMLDAATSGKYKMEPMVLVEDCAAEGMTCDIFKGACADKK